MATAATTMERMARAAARGKIRFALGTKGYPYLLLSPTLLVLVLVGLIPFIYMLIFSLRDLNFAAQATGGPFVGLANYKSLLRDAHFWNSMKLTTIFVVASVTVEFAIGFAVALALNRQPRGRRAIVSLLLIPTMLAPIVVAVIWKIMLAGSWGFLTFNLFNKIGMFLETSVLSTAGWSLAALIGIDIWQWTPLVILVLFAGLQSLPVHPFEASAVDGASKWQTFRYVTLPMLAPLIVVLLFIRVIDAFGKVFETVFFLTGGGPGITSEIVTLFVYRSTFEFWKLTDSTAAAVVIFVIFFAVVSLFFNLAKKRFRIFE